MLLAGKYKGKENIRKTKTPVGKYKNESREYGVLYNGLDCLRE
jgi:hypothetical protein